MQINFKLLNEAVDIDDNFEIINIDPNHDRDTYENVKKLFLSINKDSLLSYGTSDPSGEKEIDKSNRLIAFHKGIPIAMCAIRLYDNVVLSGYRASLPITSIVRYLANLPINLPQNITNSRKYIDALDSDAYLQEIAIRHGIYVSGKYNYNEETNKYLQYGWVEALVNQNYQGHGLISKLTPLLMQEKLLKNNCHTFIWAHYTSNINSRKAAIKLGFTPYTPSRPSTDSSYMIKIIP